MGSDSVLFNCFAIGFRRRDRGDERKDRREKRPAACPKVDTAGPTGLRSRRIEWLNGLAEWPRSVAWMERLAEQLATCQTAGTHARPFGVVPGTTLLRNLFFLVVVLIHGFRRLLPPY